MEIDDAAYRTLLATLEKALATHNDETIVGESAGELFAIAAVLKFLRDVGVDKCLLKPAALFVDRQATAHFRRHYNPRLRPVGEEYRLVIAAALATVLAEKLGVSVSRALDESAKVWGLSKNFRDEINRGRANFRAQIDYDDTLARFRKNLPADFPLIKNVKSGR